MDMSKPLNRRAAANAFARGESGIRTRSALTFVGDVAWSYCEPIAIRVGSNLLVTTAKFSMTTSHHVGAVHGAWNIARAAEGEDNPYRAIPTGHAEIRDWARALGQGGSLGPRGRHYERNVAA